MNPIATMSPRLMARMAGGSGFLKFMTATVGQVFVLGTLVVTGNAEATAANIVTHQPLLVFGFGVSLVALASQLARALLFYHLFRPVSRPVSLAGLGVILIACAFQGLAALLYAAPLPILTGAGPLGALSPGQQAALAFVSLKLNGYAYGLSLALFGAWCVVYGWLIVRSNFMPRVFGVLLAIAGIGWMTFLAVGLARPMLPLVATLSFVGQIPLMLWLLVVGVNERRWDERARAALPRTAEAV